MPDDIQPLGAKERAELMRLVSEATPGPWLWNSYDAILVFPCPDGLTVAYVNDVPNPDERKGDELFTVQGRANAQLIAACREAIPRYEATCRALEAECRGLAAERDEARGVAEMFALHMYLDGRLDDDKIDWSRERSA